MLILGTSDHSDCTLGPSLGGFMMGENKLEDIWWKVVRGQVHPTLCEGWQRGAMA